MANSLRSEGGMAKQRLRNQSAAKRSKKVRFLTLRMWVATILSALQKDRGRIPDNIGDKVLLTNNLYITKAFLNSVIQISGLTLNTPVTLFGEIIRNLRAKGSKALVDVTVKNSDYDVLPSDAGLKSRITVWEAAMDIDDIDDEDKEVAARCLYTVDKLRSGERLFESRIFLTIRAKDGFELSRAETIVKDYLNSIGANYKVYTSGVKDILSYIALVSNKVPENVKDIRPIVNTEQTLAQMMPNVGGQNATEGIYCGIDVLNGSEFMLDDSKVTGGRNYYIYSPTGGGKTVLALNMVAGKVEQGYAGCLMDIKGNEFTNYVRSTGGYVVSLRESSCEYVNSYRLCRDETTDEDAEMYYKSNLSFSKLQLKTLAALSKEHENELEGFLDEFLEAMYINLGVVPTNRNTWVSTNDLDPFRVYNMLVDYTTPNVFAKFPNVAKPTLTSLRMYMTKNGSKSYIFTKEFEYADILRARTLAFDFGILEKSSSASVDPVLFQLRFSFMQRLNAEFVAYKYAHGIKVIKVLEESQIVTDDILKGYVEEITLRRSQGQTTILLGNSISALTNNPISAPIIENMRALFIGELAHDAREEVIKQFDLEEQRELLTLLGSSAKFANSFLFVNKMQKGSLTPIVKVILDKDKEYKMYTPNKQNNALVK